MLRTLWLRRKHPQERGHERRHVLELEFFFDCESELRGLWGLGCACGFGLRGRHLIRGRQLIGPLLIPLVVLLSLRAIWYLQAMMLGLLPTIRDLQATVLAALLIEMATTAHKDQAEDKSDDDADDDADDASG